MDQITDFVAIDFETAVGQDSPCAVGIVVVENGEIVEEFYKLIQPPGNNYSYATTQIHGLTSEDTKESPTFAEVYPKIRARLARKVIVAHNELFDRNVLQKTMRRCNLDYEELNIADKWQCTRNIFRKKGFKPCDLATLSGKHNIPLNHHEALSDARACAKLFLVGQDMS